MFDGLLKSKFFTKCKSLIKMTKTRIEMVRRKRNAMQKYLKNDIVDLLKTGLDINAYGRAEGLLVELNISSCYDFLEECCGCVLNHLSMMSKQRECPEECREAVSSLMFAAARFADLPELRELRSVFTDRYGNSLDSYVSLEFTKKLKSMPPTKDMKLQLLQEIAIEAGIEWNSKALEQKLYNPPAPEQDCSKNTNDDKYKRQRNKDEPVQRLDNHDAQDRHINMRDYTAPDKNKEGDYTAPDKNKKNLSSHGRRSVIENDVPERRNQGYHSHERLEETPTKDIQMDQSALKSVKNDSDEEVTDKLPLNYRVIPPPYTRPKVTKNDTSLEAPREDMGPTKSNGHVNEEDNHDQEKPKPRSVRSSRLKPPPGYQNPNGIKQEEDAKRGLKIFNKDARDQLDEEERLDRLLVHFSTKQSHSEQAKNKQVLGHPPSEKPVIDTYKATRNKSKDGPPARATSLPPEPTTQNEATKGPNRASSFQPDMKNPTGHVHPKLPDYDDFVARLAALKGE